MFVMVNLNAERAVRHLAEVVGDDRRRGLFAVGRDVREEELVGPRRGLNRLGRRHRRLRHRCDRQTQPGRRNHQHS